MQGSKMSWRSLVFRPPRDTTSSAGAVSLLSYSDLLGDIVIVVRTDGSIDGYALDTATYLNYTRVYGVKEARNVSNVHGVPARPVVSLKKLDHVNGGSVGICVTCASSFVPPAIPFGNYEDVLQSQQQHDNSSKKTTSSSSFLCSDRRYWGSVGKGTDGKRSRDTHRYYHRDVPLGVVGSNRGSIEVYNFTGYFTQFTAGNSRISAVSVVDSLTPACVLKSDPRDNHAYYSCAEKRGLGKKEGGGSAAAAVKDEDLQVFSPLLSSKTLLMGGASRDTDFNANKVIANPRSVASNSSHRATARVVSPREPLSTNNGEERFTSFLGEETLSTATRQPPGAPYYFWHYSIVALDINGQISVVQPTGPYLTLKHRLSFLQRGPQKGIATGTSTFFPFTYFSVDGSPEKTDTVNATTQLNQSKPQQEPSYPIHPAGVISPSGRNPADFVSLVRNKNMKIDKGYYLSDSSDDEAADEPPPPPPSSCCCSAEPSPPPPRRHQRDLADTHKVSAKLHQLKNHVIQQHILERPHLVCGGGGSGVWYHCTTGIGSADAHKNGHSHHSNGGGAIGTEVRLADHLPAEPAALHCLSSEGLQAERPITLPDVSDCNYSTLFRDEIALRRTRSHLPSATKKVTLAGQSYASPGVVSAIATGGGSGSMVYVARIGGWVHAIDMSTRRVAHVVKVPSLCDSSSTLSRADDLLTIPTHMQVSGPLLVVAVTHYYKSEVKTVVHYSKSVTRVRAKKIVQSTPKLYVYLRSDCAPYPLLETVIPTSTAPGSGATLTYLSADYYQGVVYVGARRSSSAAASVEILSLPQATVDALNQTNACYFDIKHISNAWGQKLKSYNPTLTNFFGSKNRAVTLRCSDFPAYCVRQILNLDKPNKDIIPREGAAPSSSQNGQNKSKAVSYEKSLDFEAPRSDLETSLGGIPPRPGTPPAIRDRDDGNTKADGDGNGDGTAVVTIPTNDTDFCLSNDHCFTGCISAVGINAHTAGMTTSCSTEGSGGSGMGKAGGGAASMVPAQALVLRRLIELEQAESHPLDGKRASDPKPSSTLSSTPYAKSLREAVSLARMLVPFDCSKYLTYASLYKHY